MLGVRVLVLDGVSELVGSSVSDAVNVGLDVLVGVRDTSAPKVESPIAIIVPSRKPMTVLMLETPITTTLFSPGGNLMTP